MSSSGTDAAKAEGHYDQSLATALPLRTAPENDSLNMSHFLVSKSALSHVYQESAVDSIVHNPTSMQETGPSAAMVVAWKAQLETAHCLLSANGLYCWMAPNLAHRFPIEMI